MTARPVANHPEIPAAPDGALPGAPPLVDPRSGAPLHVDEAGITCPATGARWDVVDGIAVFGPRGTAEDGAEPDGTALPDPAAHDWRFLLPLDETSRVLDLDPGDGDRALAIAPETGGVVAACASLAAARRVRTRVRAAGTTGIVAMVAGPGTLPFAPGTFDLAVVGPGLGAGGDPRPALRRLRRLLAPTGRLWWEGPAAAGRLALRREAARRRRALRDAGFAPAGGWARVDDPAGAALVPLGDPVAATWRCPDGSHRRRLAAWSARLGLPPAGTRAVGWTAARGTAR